MMIHDWVSFFNKSLIDGICVTAMNSPFTLHRMQQKTDIVHGYLYTHVRAHTQV